MFTVKIYGVLQLCKTSKKHWSYSVLKHEKKLIKIPYKPCRFWCLQGPLLRKCSKKHQKALCFSVKLECVLRLCKTSKNQRGNMVLEHPKKWSEIPYKTWGILMIFEPFPQKGPQNHQKTNAISSFRSFGIAMSKIPYKRKGKRWIRRTRKTKNPKHLINVEENEGFWGPRKVPIAKTL